MSEVTAVLLAGCLGGLVALWGVFSHRKIARTRATIDFLARSEADQNILVARRTFIKLAKAKEGLQKWSDIEHEETQEVQHIRLVLNEFELLAIGIQLRIIDFELCKRFQRGSILRFWKYASPFVIALRERTSNDMLFHEFEELTKWMEAGAKPRRLKPSWWQLWG